ncbi:MULTISPECIES: hypothetical protein [unclassified Streptomyces]
MDRRADPPNSQPEDLSYDGDRDGIWALGEHPRKRHVYVVGR